MKTFVLALRSILAVVVIAPLALASAAPGSSLHVLRLLPAPESTEVPLGGLVTIVFDRPVVPLARLGAGPAAATIAPSVPGQQRWLGTTTWAVVPANGLAPATTYTLRLNPALRAVDGSALSVPATWRFTTQRPAVAGVTPANNATGLLPRVPIDVVFNMPVAPASAQARFSLRLGAGGPPVAGAFSWRNARTMRFTPAIPLPRGSFPQVREAAGVQAIGGPLPGLKTFDAGFGVAPAFALGSSEPSDGSTATNSYVTVFLHFTAPVDLRAAPRYVSVQPALGALHVDVSDQNTLTIDGNFKPSTAYRVTVQAGLPSLLGDRLPASRTISFQTPAYQSSLYLIGAGSLNTYAAYRPLHLYANVVNVSRITLNLYRQNESQFLSFIAPSFDRSQFSPDGLPLAASFTRDVHAPLNKTVAVEVLSMRNTPLTPGYYVAVASTPEVAVQYLPLVITRSALTLKSGDNQVLVWANDLRTGAPLSGLPVRVVDANGNRILGGRTDAGGVYTGVVAPGRHLAYQTLRAFLDRPDDVAAVGSDWNNGVSPYDYNLSFDPTLNHVRMYLNTDRPIYRPGQTVYIRGVVRGDNDGRYQMLPPGESVRLTANDALGHKVFDRYLRLNSQGVVGGQLPLPDGASLGGYSLQATLSNENTSAYFTVAAYKKPTFKVLVLPDHGNNGNYVQGQRIGVTAHADYYFGAPLANAPVQWTVSSAATQFQAPGYDSYSFVDPDILFQLYQSPSNQQTSAYNGRTGAMGETAVRVPADLQGSPLPHIVTIEANITSPTQQQVAQQGTVIVHPADVYVGLSPRNYLPAPRVPQTVDVVTLRPDGTPAPRTTVTLVVQRRTIYSVEVYDPQAGYRWRNSFKDVTLRTLTVVTDGAGRAVTGVVLPDEGEFRLAASARDSLGNTTRTAAYLYSMTPDSANYIDWGIANNDRIALVADRRQYTIGQTAHILVPAPFSGMRALVTLERGTILSHRTLSLRGNGPVLDIPITGDSVPNLYVSVVLFKGSGDTLNSLPVWKMGYVRLVVDPVERALSVRITPLAPRARPGQRVTFAIHTQDGHGNPVAADVGVSLVDAAVLALAANGNGTLSDAFYAQRPLGINTATSMNLFIDRLNITPGNGAKGGGGGAGGGPGGLASLRVKFPDTAYWNPNVLTNARGDAAISLTLPDNLTTWRLSADGSTTAGTLLGSGGADLIAAKPVLIEPALPRFLAVRDQSQLGAVISNLTDAPVSLRVGGAFQAASGGPLALADRPLTVPAHADRALYWTYMPRVEGPLTVTLYANGPAAGLSDALQLSLPVEQNSLLSPEAAATAGDAAGASALETVVLPGAIEPGEGDLRLTLEPSLVSGLASAADYLLSYPYDGVEQATSRLTGLLALSSVVSGRNCQLPTTYCTLPGALPNLITNLAARLYALQGYDGGWGWWPEDPSDPYLSAYAYEGLTFLHERGHPVDAGVLTNAANYLQGRLTAGPGDPYAPNDPTRALILYALGRAGHPDAAAAAALYERRARLTPAARAELALALAGAFGAADPRVRTLINEISDAARLTSIDAHWDAGAFPDWETMESSAGNTAEVTRMLINLDPRNPLIPRAVRWLMAQRGVGAPGTGLGPDGAWLSTQATALALRAVAFYALNTGDTHPRYSYSVQVNGATVQQGTVTPDTAGQPRVMTISIDQLSRAGGRAAIRILRGALPGGPAVTSTPLHYTLRLRFYPVPGSVGAVDSGISITRRYLTHDGSPAGSSAATGSTLTVELRLIAPQDLSRVVIEDPLPAGAEAVDGTLLTSSIFAQPGGTSCSPCYTYAPPQPGQPQDLSYYIDHTELRDDRTALFATAIPAGTYVYRYTIHLTTPGLYHVLPAHVAQLYEPEVYGHTAEGSFTVR